MTRPSAKKILDKFLRDFEENARYYGLRTSREFIKHDTENFEGKPLKTAVNIYIISNGDAAKSVCRIFGEKIGDAVAKAFDADEIRVNNEPRFFCYRLTAAYGIYKNNDDDKDVALAVFGVISNPDEIKENLKLDAQPYYIVKNDNAAENVDIFGICLASETGEHHLYKAAPIMVERVKQEIFGENFVQKEEMK